LPSNFSASGRSYTFANSFRDSDRDFQPNRYAHRYREANGNPDSEAHDNSGCQQAAHLQH
jgi:hypothetical protein